jgi:chromosome segregation ATPase
VTDLPLALRELRVPALSDEDAAGRLRTALEGAGMDLGDEELDLVELTMTAEAWLSEVSDADHRRQAAEEEQTALEGERWVLRAEAASVDEITTGSAPGLDAEEGREARLQDARAQLEQAENRWLAHEVAEERWAELAPELEEATATAAAAAVAAAGAEAELAEAIADLTEVLEREHELRSEADGAEEAEAEAQATLLGLTTDTSLDPETLAAAIESAERQHREAEDALETENRALANLDAEGQAAAVEIERLQDIVAAQGSGTATEAEELEWYLLARLAAQRSVSVAGSLPLLLDDALRGLDAGGVDHLLTSLERMAEAVQVIVISEDPVVASWAQGAGPARAAVVRPGAP